VERHRDWLAPHFMDARGRFLEVEAVKDAEGEGGYARPLTDEENERLRAELESMAQWLGLSGIEVVPNGDLAHHL